MKISYKKLWKLLIDKDMMKKDLQAFIDADVEDLGRRSDFYEAFVERYH